MFRPFDPYEDDYEYSPNVRNFGNPVINTLMRGVFGGNLKPVPGDGQDIHDSFIQRERSMQFMNLQREGFMNNRFFQQMGVSQNPLLGAIGALGASPDSLVGRAISPLLGGNPMAASMQLYAGMSGANVMGNFGRTESMGAGEVSNIMSSLTKNLYNVQKFDGAGGIGEEINKKHRDFLTTRYKEGTKGQDYLKDIGIALTGDKDTDLANIGKIDITDEKSQTVRNIRQREVTKAVGAADIESDLEQMENTEDKKQKEKLNKRLKEKLKNRLKLETEQIDKLTRYGEGKDLDAGKVREEVDKYKQADPSAKFADEAAAYKKQTQRFTSFNFENSRGFKIEDFTSAYVQGANYRMLGDLKGTTPAEAMNKMFQNGTGALSAARSVFGNKSGGELMGKISDLMGNTAVDLTKADGEGGSKEVEELLRKTKATARVAGVSIQAMLGIIKATKELAANNPQLQYMSGSAVSEMAVKAVGTAADLGRGMSAEDYRRAGGSQGLAAEEVKTKMNYAQSSLGGFSAVMLNLADASKDEDTKKAVKELFESGQMTAGGLDKGGMDTLVKAFGGKYTAANLLDMGQSDDMIQQSFKNTKVSKQILGADGDKNLLNAFYEGMSNRGLDRDEFVKGYKDSGLSLDQYINTNVRPLTTDESGTKALKSAESAIRKELIRSTRTDEQNASLDKLVQKQADESAALDKKHGALYQPVVTQVVSAIAGGKNSSYEEITQAMSGIFAAKDEDSDIAKRAIERVRESGAKIAVTSGRYSSVDALKKAGIVGDINTFLKDRASVMNARGEIVPEGMDTANLTDRDYENVIETSQALKNIPGAQTAEGARTLLERLENDTVSMSGYTGTLEEFNALSKDEQTQIKQKGYSKLNAENQKLLSGLRTAKQTDVLNHDESYSKWLEGTPGAFNAAVEQAAIDTEVSADLKTNERRADTNLADRLQAQTGGDEDLQAALKAYTVNGKLDAAALRKDVGEGDRSKFYTKLKDQGAFGGLDEAAIKKRFEEKGTANVLGAEVNTAENDIENYKNERVAQGHVSPEDKARTDMVKAFQDLTKVMTTGGGIGTALEKLVKAIPPR